MNNKVFTIQEIQMLKFYELPNCMYNAIASEIRKMFGTLADKLMTVFDKAKVYELDQFIDIYKYIIVIQKGEYAMKTWKRDIAILGDDFGLSRKLIKFAIKKAEEKAIPQFYNGNEDNFRYNEAHRLIMPYILKA